MATLASFDDMLNEHLDYDLMRNEMKERAWLIANCEIDDTWKGGTIPVPFEGAAASSFKMGGLTDENDVSEFDYVRGEITGYKECWGTLKFHSKDLTQHVSERALKKGLINKASFLKILPNQTEQFIAQMKEIVSIALLNGPHFAKLTSDSTANDGVVTLDRIERVHLGMKVIVDDDNSSPMTGYVRGIDINAGTATLYDARTGGSVLDFSGTNMTTAQNAKCYIDGGQTSVNQFTSLRSQLLPASAGGSSTLFGQTKLSYPYLQSVASSGSTMSRTNILDQIFDHWTRTCKLGRGYADRVLMSFTNIGHVMKLLEAGSGAYRHISTKVSPYKYIEIKVGGVKGELTLVGVWEFDEDIMMFLDMDAFKLHTLEMFKRHIDPNGNSFYTVRSNEGYYYLVDVMFYGELSLFAPGKCGVLHSIAIV